ncbi:MAG: hypothetical protein RLZZ385_2069 [Pseudomonadota bacterium]|jgi:alkyl sulfatase BDS1-like metallo-beta-lactamase superfamily hydrolase
MSVTHPIMTILYALSLAYSLPALAQVPLTGDPTQAGANQTEALRITGQIYQATGFGNTFLVITPEGNVVIDTSSAAVAPRHKRLLQAVDDGPVKAIILTHGHGDHTGGVALWREADTQVIAQEEHYEFMNYQYRLRGMFAGRNAAQFPGLVRPNAVVATNAATATNVQPMVVGSDNYGAAIQPGVLFDEDYSFSLGGLTFELMHTPGETYDHLSVWIPELRAVFVGDNFYGSFPNIYTLRGTKPRWALDYVNSLDRVLALQPEILIPSHGEPLHGNAVINQAVGKYRDAIEYVHDATVAGMNAGKDVYTLMQEIQLPSDLNVGEGYGTIAWTVRGIYEGYMGWFDGNPATMYAVPPSAVYPDLVALAGGADEVATLARSYLAADDAIRALHAADIALAADPDNVTALQTRLAALELQLRSSANSNETGWLQYGIRQTRVKLDGLAP